ncbi:MAG TPA: PEP/pyruvate-binding domain-containing protein [Candidatus Saccharimonadales bacterium]|nr:PEP/pyruvate-binding domain-containing protein [Candidatus Saccharimonadales bacterium]
MTDNSNRVIFLDEISSEDLGLVGGKAMSLGEMIKADINVPPGFSITTAVYKSGFTTEAENQVLEAFDKLGADRVAVRSSAVAEDSKQASWAGQLETYLNVDRAGLIKAVKKCWDSVNSEHAKEYAKQNNMAETDKAVGVVVQKMVDSEVSGVMFTANPVTNNLEEIIIEAIYGLGELIVQGAVTPESFIISKQTGQVIGGSPSRQDKMLIYKNGKNVEQKVPDDKLKEPTLKEEDLKSLIKAAEKIEKHYGLPQDIEWAIRGGELYITQSRPITTLSETPAEPSLEQEFIEQNGGDIVMRYEGDFMPFQLVIEWWSYIGPQYKMHTIKPILFFYTPKRTTGYISHTKYNGAAKDTFAELVADRLSLQRFKDEYERYSSILSDRYEEYFKKENKPINEEKCFELFKAVHEEFQELITWTLFYEQLDETTVNEVLKDKKIDLKKFWEMVKLPVFASFDTRRKAHMIPALEGKITPNYLRFAFSDYTFFADEDFVKKELAKTDINKLKADIKEAEEATAKAKEQLEEYLSTADAITKNVVEILGWVLFCRDERKDMINKIELLMFSLSEQLFGFWGIDKDLLTYTGVCEVLRGREYIRSVEIDLPKRRDGFSVLFKTDGTFVFGHDDLEEQLDSLDNFILGQHASKDDQIITGEIGNVGKASGNVRIIRKNSEFDTFQDGEILVTGMTRPEFVPLMQKSIAIVTDEGGITSHAAIVSRELNKPCIIGTRIATQILKTGDKVEVDASNGTIKILKPESFTFEKIFTREESMIFGELLGQELDKWLVSITDKKIPTMFFRIDRNMLECWLCDESTKILIDDVYKNNAENPNYLEGQIEVYKNLINKMAKYEAKKHAKSLDELKEYMDLFSEGIKPLHVIFFTPFHEKAPKFLSDLAVKIRSEDAMFDNADIYIRDSLIYLYPQLNGIETFMGLKDLEKPDLNEIKLRKDDFYCFKNEYINVDIGGFKIKYPNFVLKIDQINPNQKTIEGMIAYKGLVKGEVQVINLKKDVAKFQPGNILVAPMTTPHYLPAMKEASAFITDEGGVTCHAAIVAREMKTPCIIGTKIATQILKNGDLVEVDANKGVVTIL